MGWKSVKEHYRIEHIVKVEDGKILIGSGYVGDLLTITPDGKVIRNEVLGRGSAELNRYEAELLADRDKLVELIAAEDEFSASLPVYTYNEGEIVERRCEEHGWPNVTHDGALMYDNLFFADRYDAIRAALRNSEAAIPAFERMAEDERAQLARTEARLEAIRQHGALYRAEAERAGLTLKEHA